jgi:hypothetical protein
MAEAEIISLLPALQRNQSLDADTLARIFEEQGLFDDLVILQSVLKVLTKRIAQMHTFMNESYTWRQQSTPKNALLINTLKIITATTKAVEAITQLPNDEEHDADEKSVCFAESFVKLLLHTLVRHLASEMDPKALAELIRDVSIMEKNKRY